MGQRVRDLVRSVRSSDGGAPQADLALPNPRRLLIVGIISTVVLALTVIGAVWFAVASIDQASVSAETERAQVALRVVLADGALPDVATAERLAEDFGFTGAHFVSGGARPGEISTTVPGSDARLSWQPRRFGTEMFYKLAPIRLFACGLFLAGVVFVLNRLYRISRDLEKRRQAAQELASRDALTGLYNRLGFDQQLARSASNPALLYLDLDGFKQVNDSFGHNAGDDLLRIVAQRLTGIARDGDMVARIGGDEFAILRGPPTSRAELAELASDIGLALSEPVKLGLSQIQVGASIGIAMGSAYGNDNGRLVGAADAALYRAKALPGHAFVFADTPMADAA